MTEISRIQFMLNVQRELQIMYLDGKAPFDLEPEAKMDYLRTQFLSLEDELHEAMQETGWKPWATSNHINREAFKGELVDAWHFFMNLMLAVGMTGDELYMGYIEKSAVNRKRQEDGYDGVTTKCPGCKRAYDDKAVLCQAANVQADRPAFCGTTSRYVSSAGVPMIMVIGTGWVEDVAA